MSKGRFRVIVSENESMHGCAPLGEEIGRFHTKGRAEILALDAARLLSRTAAGRVRRTKYRAVIVACGVRALVERLLPDLP